ncbi:MAG: BREX-6 system phosphatase PglZ [Myxococcota bacterium]
MSETIGIFLNAPVSAFLEAEVRNQVRLHGIVVWLDLDAHYNGFVETLIQARARGELPYQVLAYRGSHLQLMMALSEVADGVDKPRLLLHLPGFTEETIRHTPLLELYEPGVRYRKALDTLITEAGAGRVRPEQLTALKSRPLFTLTDADRWLAELLMESDTGLDAQLRVLKPQAVLDELLSGEQLAKELLLPAREARLWERLSAWFGLPRAWRDVSLPPSRPQARDVAYAAASWALCVEYVDDLKRPPVSALLIPAKSLPRAVVETCRNLAAHLREHHSAFYRRTADETEALLADEVEAARAEDLGRIDTFRFEEDKVLKAALTALELERFDLTAEWAALRLDPKSSALSPWLQADPSRASAWQLVRDAARLGQTILKAGEKLGVQPHAEDALELAIHAYVARGAAVDQAHRQLEQRRLALLYPQVPAFETLRARLDSLRTKWRTWADLWAREFNSLCRTHGFLPPAPLRQRHLFDDVVRPLTLEPGTTAYFVVDALRFEMGEELSRHLEGSSQTTIRLKAALAELPTVTEVGMNVLAPVEKSGRLHPSMNPEADAILGFQTGEFRVFDPETRKRAMHTRVGGTTCPWLSLDDVLSRESSGLKRTVAQAKLVVVHSQEIDQAGESGGGAAGFEHVMQKLRAAWRLLRDAGVRRFVFTSDHGFLLLDERMPSAQRHGRRIDPSRRHMFSPVAADHAEEVRVSLSALGYEGTQGFIMFPESTAVFDTGRRPMNFVHGGNSLQERVIPVLTVLHRASAGSSGVHYQISAEVREAVAGMHCIEIKVEMSAQHTLNFGGPKEVELALKVLDPPESELDAVQVELCQTRGKARIEGGGVIAPVGIPFELFFRLTGSTDARVLIELYHPSFVAEIATCKPASRFAVTVTRSPTSAASAPPTPTSPASWLESLTDPGARQVFEHLTAHGIITEEEATKLLGGSRLFRRIASKFEEYAQKAPFPVRIETVGGLKRYIREGGR